MKPRTQQANHGKVRAPGRSGFLARAVTLILAIGALIVGGLVFKRVREQTRPTVGIPPSPDTDAKPTILKGSPLFQDVTAAAGIDFVHVFGTQRTFRLPEQIGSGGAFLDYDNDGDMDLYLVQNGILGRNLGVHRNRVYRNAGNGRFVDASPGSGADIGGYGMGCAAADYDNDGDVDLFVSRFGSSVLLANRGDGTFEDVTPTAGTHADGFATSAAFLDYDRDGLLDLFVTRYVDWSPAREDACYAPSGARDYCGPLSYHAESSGVLYHNLGGRFEDVSTASGIAAAKGNGLGVLATDFDGDGWVDIYVANDQTPAFLWMNQRDGTFLENAALSGAAFNADGLAIAGMGVVSEDLDDDGDYDLLVTNIRNQSHLCLRNQAGVFDDVSHAWGLSAWSVPWTGFGIALFDQDHDGRLDGVVANGAVNVWGTPFREENPYAEPKQFFRRDDRGRFYDASAEAGPALAVADVSRAAIVGDYDNDGDVDVLITNNGGPAQLLRNENRPGLSWTMLDLIPMGGGRHAINARLELRVKEHLYRREIRPHAGYLSSNDPRVHVGLGQARRIDRLGVTWPDGKLETWDNLPVNQHLTLRQGSGTTLPGANEDSRP